MLFPSVIVLMALKLQEEDAPLRKHPVLSPVDKVRQKADCLGRDIKPLASVGFYTQRSLMAPGLTSFSASSSSAWCLCSLTDDKLHFFSSFQDNFHFIVFYSGDSGHFQPAFFVEGDSWYQPNLDLLTLALC